MGFEIHGPLVRSSTHSYTNSQKRLPHIQAFEILVICSIPNIIPKSYRGQVYTCMITGRRPYAISTFYPKALNHFKPILVKASYSIGESSLRKKLYIYRYVSNHFHLKYFLYTLS